MKRFTDMMLDLETLDTTPHAVILQIGICMFNRKDGMDSNIYSKSWSLDIDEQVATGRTISRDTLEFWTILNNQGWIEQMAAQRMPVEDALADFIATVHQVSMEELRVWAKGTHFDIGILNTTVSQDILPWSFRNIHDLRTWILAAMSAQQTLDYDDLIHVHNEKPHDAEHDAIAQARLVQKINGFL